MSISEKENLMVEEILEDNQDREIKLVKESSQGDSASSRQAKRRLRAANRSFRPIILSFLLLLMAFPGMMRAQINGSVSLGARYSDNVFSLSDYDLDRWDQDHPFLDFAETTDDVSLLANVDIGYSFHYKWWKITPSASVTLSENVKNKEKYRRDALARIRVDRYYWNFTALYGYYPHVYLRHYNDSDGTDEPEPYIYERDLVRGDLNVRPFNNTSVRLHGRYERYRYNEFFTEYDGEATTMGVALRHNFPYFGLEAGYFYRVMDNSDNMVDPVEDASYESDRYEITLLMKKMLLNNNKPKGATWQPSIEIATEQRFFQGTDDWYGGREDTITNLRGTLSFDLTKDLNLKLDYTHVYRNVDSPNESVLRLKEYSENRLGASLSYSF